eukprot:TRINITY_DN2955_c0_g2_i1.p1 TRINITY_DN2955_c0_g2~~TRINITY_DN2955_c0_g2_i1.p1  ORF type:complete len:646 (+),score=159.40 TRINITY_DN2955_c0_g2_i1:139-2076(+)
MCFPFQMLLTIFLFNSENFVRFRFMWSTISPSSASAISFSSSTPNPAVQAKQRLIELGDLFLKLQEDIKKVRDSIESEDVDISTQYSLVMEKIEAMTNILCEVDGLKMKENLPKLISPLLHESDDNPADLFDLLEFETRVNESFEKAFGFKLPLLAGSLNAGEEFQHIFASVKSLDHQFAVLVEQAIFLPPNKGEGDFIQYGNTDNFVTKVLAFQNNLQGRDVIQYSRGITMKKFMLTQDLNPISESYSESGSKSEYEYESESESSSSSDSDSESESDSDSSSTDVPKPKRTRPFDDYRRIKLDFMASIDGIFLVGEDQQKETEDYDPWTQMSPPLPQPLKRYMKLALDISKKGICFGYAHCGTKFQLYFMNSDSFEEIQLGKSVVPLSVIFIITRLMRSLSNCLLGFSQQSVVMKGNNCVFKRITSAFFQWKLYQNLDAGKKSQFLIHLEKYDNEEDEGRIILKLTPLCERQSTAQDVTENVWNFIACVLLALNELHNAGYCHRDISLPNVMRYNDYFVLADLEWSLDLSLRDKTPLEKQHQHLVHPEIRTDYTPTPEELLPLDMHQETKNRIYDFYNLGALVLECYKEEKSQTQDKVLNFCENLKKGKFTTALEALAVINKMGVVLSGVQTEIDGVLGSSVQK